MHSSKSFFHIETGPDSYRPAMTLLRSVALAVLAAALFLGATGCTTPQERSGRNPRPFNSPASWETNPYGDMFRN